MKFTTKYSVSHQVLSQHVNDINKIIVMEMNHAMAKKLVEENYLEIVQFPGYENGIVSFEGVLHVYRDMDFQLIRSLLSSIIANVNTLPNNEVKEKLLELLNTTAETIISK